MTEWIDPQHGMPEKNLYAFPIEITNSKGEKQVVSGKWDDATTRWVDDEGEKLEVGTWTVTGWMPLPKPRAVENTKEEWVVRGRNVLGKDVVRFFSTKKEMKQYIRGSARLSVHFKGKVKQEGEPRQPKKRSGWLNVYDDGNCFFIHPDKQTADEAHRYFSEHLDRLACVRVEFEEGEGL